jgi:uncharacterized protein (DUF697 family)
MKETPIFRNIQHIPRIWGVTYPKLFASLGAGLLVTTLGFFLSSEGTALVKVMVIGLGAVTTLSLYAACLWVDSTDQLERDAAGFLKDEMNSQCLSLQRVQFLDKEGVDALPRSAARHQPA